MAFALWDPSLETGNASIDKQHKYLFQLVNELHDAIIGGSSADAIGPALDKMIQYTINHFHDEEIYWREKKLPWLAHHLEAHKALTTHASEIQGKFKRGESVLGVSLSKFLKDWLNHHIRGEDKRAIDYLRDNNLL